MPRFETSTGHVRSTATRKAVMELEKAEDGSYTLRGLSEDETRLMYFATMEYKDKVTQDLARGYYLRTGPLMPLHKEDRTFLVDLRQELDDAVSKLRPLMRENKID